MDFYRVDEAYIDFLKGYEKTRRGVTKVPDIKYTHRNKFAFGAVLEIHGILYYVLVSSFSTPQEANILIREPENHAEVLGSLRFNYMIPVPDKCLSRLIINDIQDIKYRLLLRKEYRFCQANAARIQKKAESIYSMVISNRKQKLTENSCDFKLLEEGYMEYLSGDLRHE